MSAVGDAFVKAFGKPDPATPSGLRFLKGTDQRQWEKLHTEVGAGWYRDGFLYLFGDGLAELSACLDAWSFLVPPCDDRVIVGKNAYGALLVVDNMSQPDKQRVYVLDPLTVTYAGDPNIMFVNLLGAWLPRNLIPGFLDDSAYRAWREANKAGRLELDDVLGIKIPKSLGGKLEANNLQLDGIVDYYRTTAPIYAAAFTKLKV